jgi:hypothetical protein
MTLNAEQRRALNLLAGAGARGVSEAVMIDAHAFSINLLVDLIHHRLITAEPESIRRGHRTVHAVRLQIAAAGRKALESDS